MNDRRKKPLIVYLHRYSPEYESEQFPLFHNLMRALLPDYEIIYFSTKGAKKADNNLRRGINIIEIPFSLDRTNAQDKWTKTLLYYLYLPVIFLRLIKLKPDFIICKETLPFIPSLIGKLKIPMFTEASDWWWSILLGKRAWGRKIALFLEKIEVRQWNCSKCVVVAHTQAEAKLRSRAFPRDRPE